jgi:hypothetical protein
MFSRSSNHGPPPPIAGPLTIVGFLVALLCLGVALIVAGLR